jgi:hypothetical protein
MSLLARVHANQCLVRDCSRTRAPDAQVCDADLTELWHNRLVRQADGSYLRRRTFPARDMTGYRVAA